MAPTSNYSIETIAPARALRAYVDHYSIIEAPGSPDSTSFGVMFPLGYPMIEFNLSDGWKKSPLEFDATSTIGSNITSFTRRPFRLQPLGTVRVATARLNPLALRILVGDDVSINTIYDPSLILGRDFKEAEEKIADAKSMTSIKACLDEYFISVFHNSGIIIDERVIGVARQIIQSGGRLNIRSAVRETGVSQKRIEQLFRTHLGMSPKSYSGIVRFQRVIAAYNPTRSMTELSNIGGYFDQSHFIRHFKSLTSFTPRDFFDNQCMRTCKISNLYNRSVSNTPIV